MKNRKMIEIVGFFVSGSIKLIYIQRFFWICRKNLKKIMKIQVQLVFRFPLLKIIV